jgi:hypothetical protein
MLYPSNGPDVPVVKAIEEAVETPKIKDEYREGDIK